MWARPAAVRRELASFGERFLAALATALESDS
jgi:hypothetical protein